MVLTELSAQPGQFQFNYTESYHQILEEDLHSKKGISAKHQILTWGTRLWH